MITAQEEAWLQALPELENLFSSHHQEMSFHYGHFPLSLCYSIYAALEARGELLLVTLRSFGELVGYFTGFIRPGLHHSTCLTLSMDVFFICPEVRGKEMGAFKLFRFIEKRAKARGVACMLFSSNRKHDSGRILRAMGMVHLEDLYGKFL